MPHDSGQAGELTADDNRVELIDDVCAILSAYYDAVSPSAVAEEIVDLILEKM